MNKAEVTLVGDAIPTTENDISHSIHGTADPDEIDMTYHDRENDMKKSDSSSFNPWELAAKYSKQEMEIIRKTSQLLHRKNEVPEAEKDCIALFQFKEIALGRLIGKGNFSNVYEIKSFRPQLSIEKDNIEALLSQQEHARMFLAEHAQREKTGESRYAVKFLRPDLQEVYTAAHDLALEAHFLSSLQHPNIIKVRGWAEDGTDGFITGGNQGYFLILDCLNETLKTRISKWAKEDKKYKMKLMKNLSQKISSSREKMFGDRLQIAHDIADALTYLHKNNVIYRDLKPDNLGFDVRGDIKLFDFGLAKELPSSSDMNEETYEMSGTGSLRYMAPEVVLGNPYNLKADVYSFSLLLYEILSLKTPHAGFSLERLIGDVVLSRSRPKLKSRWPQGIKDIIEMGWSRDILERPTMEKFQSVLQYQVKNRTYLGDEGEERARRRRSLGSIGTVGRSFRRGTRRLSDFSINTNGSGD